jgi:predicted nucleic acid-binding protein
MRAYVDSDVLIWHLRGEAKASKFLKQLRDSGEYELWIGALQRAEIIFFTQPKEVEATELLLSQFSTAPVDQKIIDTAGVLFRKWRPSHGIDVNDAILAATALETGGQVFTLNKKHYPMGEVVVKKAW